jgi:hypothetical protein
MKNITIKLPDGAVLIETEEYLTELFDLLLSSSEIGIKYPTSYPCYAVRAGGDNSKVNLIYLYPVCVVG